MSGLWWFHGTQKGRLRRVAAEAGESAIIKALDNCWAFEKLWKLVRHCVFGPLDSIIGRVVTISILTGPKTEDYGVISQRVLNTCFGIH